MLNVIYAECHKQTHYARVCYTECRYAECHNAECRSDLRLNCFSILKLSAPSFLIIVIFLTSIFKNILTKFIN
jgi:hypothetical protein